MVRKSKKRLTALLCTSSSAPDAERKAAHGPHTQLIGTFAEDVDPRQKAREQKLIAVPNSKAETDFCCDEQLFQMTSGQFSHECSRMLAAELDRAAENNRSRPSNPPSRKLSS